MPQLMFYVTYLDIVPVLAQVENDRPIQYTRTGLFASSSASQTYLSHKNIPDLGIASHPTAIGNQSFLVSQQDAEIIAIEAPQRQGTALFAIDQRANKDTIVFRPGGLHTNSVILCRMAGTISTTYVSQRLYSEFERAIRRHFRKQRGFFVGPDAFKAWNSGVRLTIGVSSPPEFDFRP